METSIMRVLWREEALVEYHWLFKNISIYRIFLTLSQMLYLCICVFVYLYLCTCICVFVYLTVQNIIFDVLGPLAFQKYSTTRSLGARWAPSSSWRPFGHP